MLQKSYSFNRQFQTRRPLFVANRSDSMRRGDARQSKIARRIVIPLTVPRLSERMEILAAPKKLPIHNVASSNGQQRRVKKKRHWYKPYRKAPPYVDTNLMSDKQLQEAFLEGRVHYFTTSAIKSLQAYARLLTAEMASKTRSKW